MNSMLDVIGLVINKKPVVWQTVVDGFESYVYSEYFVEKVLGTRRADLDFHGFPEGLSKEDLLMPTPPGSSVDYSRLGIEDMWKSWRRAVALTKEDLSLATKRRI